MQIPVLVERVKGNGYRASGTEPFAVSAKGSTREEALAKLRAKIQSRLKNETEIVGLEVGPQPPPLAEFAGMFKDDPDFEDVLKIMAANRKRMDEDADVP
jgi:predicted RNase H-like HicB family nuclease